MEDLEYSIPKSRKKEYSKEQISVLKLAAQKAKEIFLLYGEEIVKLYFTPEDIVNAWFSYDRNERENNLERHLANLDGRWETEVGIRFVHSGGDEFKRTVIRDVLDLCVESCMFEEEKRKKERKYRWSILATAKGMELSKEKRGIFGIGPEKRKELNIFGGKKVYAMKRGLFAMSKEDKREAAIKGGKEVYRRKSGAFGVSREEKIRQGKRLGLVGTLKRGQIPWNSVQGGETDLSEKDYVISLLNDKRYYRGSHVNLKKIAEEVNRVFHEEIEVRNVGSISNFIARYKRSLSENPHYREGLG